MARSDDDGPRPLSDSLRKLASKVVRVDLVGFAGVEAAWPSVPSADASAAIPVRLSDGELTVAVPSGAHAARARRDAPAMLAELAGQLDDPPTRLRVAVQPR
ncbi:MAG TPA: DciA family protein [Acidimicrobiales bacterium]|nr:DciA family protein [Acidimicrobiales bacterium]